VLRTGLVAQLAKRNLFTSYVNTVSIAGVVESTVEYEFARLGLVDPHREESMGAPVVVVKVLKGSAPTHEDLVDWYSTAVKVRYREQFREAQPGLRDQLARTFAENLLAKQVNCHRGSNEVTRAIRLSAKTDAECQMVDDLMDDLVQIREVDHLVMPGFTDKVKLWAGKIWSHVEMIDQGDLRPTGGGARG
jgi:hypothetical protein